MVYKKTSQVWEENENMGKTCKFVVIRGGWGIIS